MRVAIEYNAALRQLAGIGRYTRELVRAVASLSSDDELILFFAASDVAADAPGMAGLLELRATHPSIRAVPIPLTERWLTILWQRARLPVPVERWTGPIDILHAPDFVLPPARTRRTLLTVHDLSFRLHPEAAHAQLRRYLEQAVPRSLRRARRVLADSQSTANDLQQLMGVRSTDVTVLYPGIGAQFKRVEDPVELARVRTVYNLPERFVLHIGTIEPRKNLERLMHAYAEVRETLDAPLGLVLGGKPGWLADPILQLARSTPGVQLIGPVADEDLPALYTLAAVLAYPTLYEGFGFPPLEALACGTPAVTSNTSSLPEIVADIAIMIEPTDTHALADALRQTLLDPRITAQARTIGPRQAAHFTWERAADQLLNLYHTLAAEPGSAQPRVKEREK